MAVTTTLVHFSIFMHPSIVGIYKIVIYFFYLFSNAAAHSVDSDIFYLVIHRQLHS